MSADVFEKITYNIPPSECIVAYTATIYQSFILFTPVPVVLSIPAAKLLI